MASKKKSAKKKAEPKQEPVAAKAEPKQESVAAEIPKFAAEIPKRKQEAPKKQAPKQYVIADGRSICCGGKILTQGMPVEPKDLNNNPAAAVEHFDKHRGMGTIVEKQ